MVAIVIVVAGGRSIISAIIIMNNGKVPIGTDLCKGHVIHRADMRCVFVSVPVCAHLLAFCVCVCVRARVVCVCVHMCVLACACVCLRSFY